MIVKPPKPWLVQSFLFLVGPFVVSACLDPGSTATPSVMSYLPFTTTDGGPWREHPTHFPDLHSGPILRTLAMCRPDQTSAEIAIWEAIKFKNNRSNWYHGSLVND